MKKDIVTRRNLFKKIGLKILPIFLITTGVTGGLASIKQDSIPSTTCNGCSSTCYKGCKVTHKGMCGTCTSNCMRACEYVCSKGCKVTHKGMCGACTSNCKQACEYGCSKVCKDMCETVCTGCSGSNKTLTIKKDSIEFNH